MTTHARYVKLEKFHELTGYTVKAVQRKIEERVWREGKEYIKAPDGHVLMDMEGYYKWADGRSRAA